MLLTGASSGLGVALARRLSRAGRPLILIARRGERLEEVARALPAPAVVVSLDLAREDRIKTLESRLSAAGIAPSQIEIVINNAGMGYYGEFLDQTPESVRIHLRLNAEAPVEIGRWIVPKLVARGGGTVCNVASVAAFTSGALMTTYYASKALLLSFGESLYEELRGTGVTVVTCCPGPFKSEFHANAGIDGDRLGSLPNAARIAAAIVRAIKRKRAVAPIGVTATIWAILGPRLPRAWSRRIIHFVQKRRVKKIGER